MANSSSLYLRINLNGKQQYVRPVRAANGKLKPQFGLVNCAERHYPGAIYALRFRLNGRRVWENVGSDPIAAQTAKLRRDKILEATALGLELKDDRGSFKVSPTPTNRIKLTDAASVYLDEVKSIHRPNTFKARSLTLRYFLESCKKTYLEQIDKSDVTGFINFMRTTKGLANRTMHSHCAGVCTLLRANGITGVTSPKDWPRFAQKEIGVYSPDEIRRLLAGCDREERLMIMFFLGSGTRDKEVVFAAYGDIDFDRKIFTVSAKPDYKFVPKSHEARSIPLPDDLIENLTKRRLLYPDAKLIFETERGQPDGHFLRRVKRLALRAGINCGQCVNRKGLSCKKFAVCKRIDLHKFRKTFATMHHRNRVDMETLRGWLGHKDLATTQIYLKYADIDGTETRKMVNSTFVAFN